MAVLVSARCVADTLVSDQSLAQSIRCRWRQLTLPLMLPPSNLDETYASYLFYYVKTWCYPQN